MGMIVTLGQSQFVTAQGNETADPVPTKGALNKLMIMTLAAAFKSRHQ